MGRGGGSLFDVRTKKYVVSPTSSKVGAVSQCNGTGRIGYEGEVGWGKVNGGRTVDEELSTGVVDDEEVDYELEDLHGRYVALPLYHPKTYQYRWARGRMKGTYPELPSTSSSVVVVICIKPSREHAIKREMECRGRYDDGHGTHT